MENTIVSVHKYVYSNISKYCKNDFIWTIYFVFEEFYSGTPEFLFLFMTDFLHQFDR